MSKNTWVTLGLMFATGAGMILASSPVDAKKPYMNAVRKHFNLTADTTTGKCILCHLAGKDPDEDTLNSYGKEVKASDKMKDLLKAKQPTPAQLDAVWQTMEALADKDSDGDGVTNGEEFALNSLPGDEKSKPDAKALETYRKAHPPKPAAK